MPEDMQTQATELLLADNAIETTSRHPKVGTPPQPAVQSNGKTSAASKTSAPAPKAAAAQVPSRPHPDEAVTQRVVPLPAQPALIAQTPPPKQVPDVIRPVQKPQPLAPQTRQVAPARPLRGKDAAQAQALRDRCRQVCLSLFYQNASSVRSLGITSAIEGEGKSFLANLTASSLAADSSDPITLIECNWERPVLHKQFGCALTPGLAEWMRGECDEEDITHKIGHNLSFIPAGDGERDAVRLLQQIRRHGLLNLFGRSNDLYVVDLPPILTSAYGSLAASIVDALIVVVRAGVTPDTVVGEACEQIKDLPVQGIVLNEVASRIPRWLRTLL